VAATALLNQTPNLTDADIDGSVIGCASSWIGHAALASEG
jgi:hypothetical protein